MFRNVKVFADGANLRDMEIAAGLYVIDGFTTNPTLMRKAGVTDYEGFARDALKIVGDKPISFEVFADDFPTMDLQARKIASWGPNVYVKIPVTNTQGEFSGPLLRSLTTMGIKVNVTAIMTSRQVRDVVACLSTKTPTVVSVFAGRAADCGIDPTNLMFECVEVVRRLPLAECLWASPRQSYDAVLADQVRAHIITMTKEQLDKLPLVGKNLTDYSLETVAMFYRDAQASGYRIEV